MSNELITLTATSTAETDAAILCAIAEHPELGNAWIPKSMIDDDSAVFSGNQQGKLVIPQWLLDAKLAEAADKSVTRRVRKAKQAPVEEPLSVAEQDWLGKLRHAAPRSVKCKPLAALCTLERRGLVVRLRDPGGDTHQTHWRIKESA